MKLSETVKGFLKMTGHYSDCAVYLAEHGYNDEYMKMLADALERAKKPSDKCEGQALMAQAYMFRGELKRALEEFEETETAKLPKHLCSVFFNNYIMCLFLLNRDGRIREIYREYNKILLADNTLVMRRTIGIKEYIDKRYENAVTVFLKLLNEPDPRATLMADICLVRSMLALDMNERASEIAELAFSRYNGRRDITAEVNRLKMKISGHLTKKSRSKKRR